jgi:hypothetical protein
MYHPAMISLFFNLPLASFLLAAVFWESIFINGPNYRCHQKWTESSMYDAAAEPD